MLKRCGRRIARRAGLQGTHVAGVLSVYHFGHQGRYLSSPSHLLDNPRKLLARDDMVLEIRLADGGAYDACDFTVGEITLALQFVSLMAREISVAEER